MFPVGENRRVCGEHGTTALHSVYGRVGPSPALLMLGTDELGSGSTSHTIPLDEHKPGSFFLWRVPPCPEQLRAGKVKPQMYSAWRLGEGNLHTQKLFSFWLNLGKKSAYIFAGSSSIFFFLRNWHKKNVRG